jgi:L-alanine-DL-glutamate epimerase-like enolase superfamily enzyme
LRFANLRIHLPAGPGLGVTLDQDKLRRYADAELKAVSHPVGYRTICN